MDELDNVDDFFDSDTEVPEEQKTATFFIPESQSVVSALGNPNEVQVYHRTPKFTPGKTPTNPISQKKASIVNLSSRKTPSNFTTIDDNDNTPMSDDYSTSEFNLPLPPLPPTPNSNPNSNFNPNSTINLKSPLFSPPSSKIDEIVMGIDLQSVAQSLAPAPVPEPTPNRQLSSKRRDDAESAIETPVASTSKRRFPRKKASKIISNFANEVMQDKENIVTNNRTSLTENSFLGDDEASGDDLFNSSSDKSGKTPLEETRKSMSNKKTNKIPTPVQRTQTDEETESDEDDDDIDDILLNIHSKKLPSINKKKTKNTPNYKDDDMEDDDDEFPLVHSKKTKKQSAKTTKKQPVRPKKQEKPKKQAKAPKKQTRQEKPKKQTKQTKKTKDQQKNTFYAPVIASPFTATLMEASISETPVEETPRRSEKPVASSLNLEFDEPSYFNSDSERNDEEMMSDLSDNEEEMDDMEIYQGFKLSDLEKAKVDKLKKIMKHYSLPVYGRKSEMIKRLTKHIKDTKAGRKRVDSLAPTPSPSKRTPRTSLIDYEPVVGSKRPRITRTKPLAYWNNERVQYSRQKRKSGDFSTVVDLIREQEDKEFLPPSKRRKYREEPFPPIPVYSAHQDVEVNFSKFLLFYIL